MRNARIVVVLLFVVIQLSFAQTAPPQMKVCVALQAKQKKVEALIPLAMQEVLRRIDNPKQSVVAVEMSERRNSVDDARDLGCGYMLRIELSEMVQMGTRKVNTIPDPLGDPAKVEDPANYDWIWADYTLGDLSGEMKTIQDKVKSEQTGYNPIRGDSQFFAEIVLKTANSAAWNAMKEFRKKNHI